MIKLPFYKWNAVKEAVEGERFLDLLQSGEELDCDLNIGGCDMPASFVWDENSIITDYAIEQYGAVLCATYKVSEDGDIEIDSEYMELGESFCMAAAGYIAESEYIALFGKVKDK